MDDTREIDAGRDDTASLGLNVLFSPDAAQRDKSIVIASSLRIGRAAETQGDLAIDDPRLSRAHVAFAKRGGACWLEDLSSTNGTFVDGERVGKKQLALGAIIRFGDTVCELERMAGEPEQATEAIGRSHAFMKSLAEADRVATAPLAVLLLGETGTGKEIMARRIHQRSQRPGKLVAINCAAIPGTLMESYLFGHKKGAFTGAISDTVGVLVEARRGTLFLDEIGELGRELQAKLLRVLETGQFTPVGGAGVQSSDVRFISATNASLAAASKVGTFRADLYARLAGYPIHLPPLRKRRCDIPLLAHHFLHELAPDRTFIFTAGLVEAMALHDWPMNVRQLRTVIGRMLVDVDHATTLQRADFIHALKDGPTGSDETSASAPARPAQQAPSRAELEALLLRHQGNIEAIADELGRHRQQVYRWLTRHGLKLESYRRRPRG